MTIRIDLNDLTQAHVNECAPYLGKCSYDAPCIIGTLLPVEVRKEFGGMSIYSLIVGGWVSAPKEQENEIEELQGAFDDGDTPRLVNMLYARGLVWPEAAA